MPYTVPSNIPGIGGRTFPLPGDPPTQPTAPAPEDTTARDAIVQQLADENGSVLGPAAPVNLDKPDPSGNLWAGYHRYTFTNGSTLDIMPNGTVIDYKPSSQANAAANAAQRVHQDITDKTTGNTYTWNPNKKNADGTTGGYDPAPGVPQITRPADQQTRQAVESGRNVTQTYDAASNSWRTTSVGDPAIPGTPVEGNTRTGVDNAGHQITQTYSNGSWIQTDIQGIPKEGATRTGVDSQGRPITQTYNNGSWFTSSMGNVPQNGDTRQAMDNQGRISTQTYSNGSWIQTGLSGIPKEGQSRQTINAQGQPVTQTYSDGSWINTAMPGAAREGDTRQNIQSGYNVEQTFQNGSWQDTKVIGRALPQAPTPINTGTGPNWTYWDPTQQQLTTVPNTNYAPTDPGRMTVQLQQQAQAQQQQLQQKVQQGTLSPDQASSQFDQWWSTNVEPMKQQIAQSQAEQQATLQAAQGQAAYWQQRPALEQAQLAQTDMVAAQRKAISLMPHLAPANAAQLMQQAITTGRGGFPSIDTGKLMQASTFSVPNLQEIGRQGAAAALANISPTAQMHLGTPGPTVQPPVGGMPDLSSLLSRGAYTFGGPGGAVPMPMTGPPAAPVPMPMTGPAGAPVPMGQTSYAIPGMDVSQMPGYVPPPYGTGMGQTGYAMPGMDLSQMPGYTPPS